MNRHGAATKTMDEVADDAVGVDLTLSRGILQVFSLVGAIYLMVLPLSDLALTDSKWRSIGWHHGTLPNLGGLRSAKLQTILVQWHAVISSNSLAGRLMCGKTHSVCRASTSTHHLTRERHRSSLLSPHLIGKAP